LHRRFAAFCGVMRQIAANWGVLWQIAAFCGELRKYHHGKLRE